MGGCAFVCVCACVRVYMYLYAYACCDVYAHTRTQMWASIHADTRGHVHACVRALRCMPRLGSVCAAVLSGADAAVPAE